MLRVSAVILSMSCAGFEPLPDGGFAGGPAGGSAGTGTGGFGVGGGAFGEGGGGPFCGGFGGAGGAGGGLSEPLVVPAKQPPPISGGTLGVMPDETVIAADPDRDEVWVLPRGSMSPVRVALQADDEPGRVIAGPGGHAFIALRRASAVAELDVATRTIVARHATCAAPRGLGWTASTSTLSVACAAGELTRLVFGASGVTASTVHLSDDLRDVVVQGDELVLSSFRSGKLLRLAANGAVSPEPGPVATLGQLRAAWRTIAMPSGTAMLYQQESAEALPASSPCTAGYGSNGFSGTAPVTPALTWSGADGGTMLLPGLTVAVDVAVAGDGRHLAIAVPGSSLFATLDLATGGMSSSRGVGQPIAVAYVGTNVVVQSREPAALYIVGSFTQQIPLSQVSRRGTGHDLFHLATPAGIACASCHPEAGDDGHVWNLPEGLRRTPTLRGGLSATAPFHWDGALGNMDALVSEIMVKRMGGAPQSTDRVAALLGWLDSVPRVPAAPVDAASAARGQALFEDTTVGCTSCHSGALGTNNTTVSVGTGLALQVPRLVELAARAPYFHDGRIATLEARFTSAGGTAHGSISQLTPAQVADLVAYLRTR